MFCSGNCQSRMVKKIKGILQAREALRVSLWKGWIASTYSGLMTVSSSTSGGTSVHRDPCRESSLAEQSRKKKGRCKADPQRGNQDG